LFLHFRPTTPEPTNPPRRSPLDWALQQRHLEIARLLLSRKASLDHVSAHGWTPLFYVWSGPMQTSSLDYLALLTSACAYTLEFNDSDTQKWPLLHRAATFGTPEDVAQLIRLGASTTSVIPPLQWFAIHEAAFYGKTECFLELLPYYEHLDIDTPDTRGWTLLHIAASAGSDGIVRHLLERGADPYRRSWPWRSHMPETLYGKRCTPAEVARAQSEERYERYVTILQDLGLASSIEEDEDEDLVFLDTKETLEDPC
jgi:ankyrin repeat protein